MPQHELPLTDRIRRIAEFLSVTDALRVRIERDGEAIEVGRPLRGAPAPASATPHAAPAADPEPLRLDAIRADLVGIFHLSRPVPVEGEVLDDDRELAYIEALGIRNPVHSLGAGRIASIAIADGAPVEYGQPLFLLDRG